MFAGTWGNSMPTYHAPGTRKGNKTWVVRGYVNGKQRECVTDANSKRGAQTYWEDWAAEIRRIERADTRDRETATFDWAADRYTANRDLSRNETRYVSKLRAHFAGWYLRDMTIDDIHSAARLLYPTCKPQTQNRQGIRPAAAIMHFAAANRWCDHIVIPLLTEDDPTRPFIYPEDLAPFIQAARATKNRPLVALLSTFQIQGWRVTETLNVERDKIDWDGGKVLRWVMKSQEWRWAAVDRALLKLWKAVPKHDSGRLFGAFRDRWVVYDAIDALGVGRFRPHMARRGFVTSLRDMGVPLEDIAGAGQWKDIKSVQVYDRDNPERARSTLGVLRGRIRGKGAKTA
jgi:Phage integrase family